MRVSAVAFPAMAALLRGVHVPTSDLRSAIERFFPLIFLQMTSLKPTIKDAAVAILNQITKDFL
jgi:hypothetical protein